MVAECRTFVRKLYTWEIEEARRVFAAQIQYDRVRIHECAPFPDQLNRIGARLKGIQKPTGHNAITLGNQIYFPVRLPEVIVPLEHPEHHKIPWLIHELTHVWQYQRMGWRYLMLALKAQFREGISAYHFGGEDGLLERLDQGAKFQDFNLEQQGDIARSYYVRLVRGENTNAWNRYIAEVKGIDSPVHMA